MASRGLSAPRAARGGPQVARDAAPGGRRRPRDGPAHGLRARAHRAALALGLCVLSPAVRAWGDEGHQIVGEIASRLLQPAARQRAFALLAADTDTLTAHDIVSETVWADRFRDSDRHGSQVHFRHTRQWHFVDIERSAPDLDRACFGHPPLPAGAPASAGVADDCVVDKIEQFSAELADAGTPPAERLLALKFLLHLVGDLHQPLHASDDHDAGGNAKKATAPGLPAGTLHGYWDTPFVQRLGPGAGAVAARLATRITPAQRQQWSQGTPADWAREASALARNAVYGPLPAPDAGGTYRLPASYVARSGPLVEAQLSKAGVRLAALLNRRLGS